LPALPNERRAPASPFGGSELLSRRLLWGFHVALIAPLVTTELEDDRVPRPMHVRALDRRVLSPFRDQVSVQFGTRELVTSVT
jgi:hypothetical protein